VIEDGFAYVGFSRFRVTKFREFATWVKNARGIYPTRIEKIDLETEKLVDTFELEPTATPMFDILVIPPDLMESGAPLG